MSISHASKFISLDDCVIGQNTSDVKRDKRLEDRTSLSHVTARSFLNVKIARNLTGINRVVCACLHTISVLSFNLSVLSLGLPNMLQMDCFILSFNSEKPVIFFYRKKQTNIQLDELMYFPYESPHKTLPLKTDLVIQFSTGIIASR